MGQLIYAGSARYEFDDRVLSHVKVAVGAKLRRKESFYLSWTVPSVEGSGRISLWLSPFVPLQFQFRSTSTPDINRVWIQALDLSASSDRGMVILPESEAASFVQAHTYAAPFDS